MNTNPHQAREPVGGCLCGGTRYRLRANPSGINDCHCVDCRRAAGAAYVTWGAVDRTQLEITAGSVRWIHFAQRVRGFAPCCGTQLFMADAPDSKEIEATMASLDDPAPFPPEKIIWTSDRLPWVVLDSALPSFPKNSGPLSG